MISIIAIIVSLLISCQKNEGGQSSKDTVSGKSSNPPVNAITGKYGYAMRVNASFYTLEKDSGSESDKTKWAASLALGEKVSVGKIRRATFSDGKIYDFIEIRRDDGTKGLAFTSHIAESGNLAVVIDEKANLYKSPKAVDVTGLILARKTIVVFFPETERDSFIEIKCYDPATQASRQNYIRFASLSVKESDIQSSILLQTAGPLKNDGAEKIRKDALLETALSTYPDSAFFDEIQALAGANTDAAIKTESVSNP